MNSVQKSPTPVSVFGGAGHFATLHAAQTLLSYCTRNRKINKDADFPAIRIFSDPLDDFNASGVMSKKDGGILMANWLRMLSSTRSDAIIWVVCNTWHASLPPHARKFDVINHAARGAGEFFKLYNGGAFKSEVLSKHPVVVFCSNGARSLKLFERHFPNVLYPDERTQAIINQLINSVMVSGGTQSDVQKFKELIFSLRHLGAGILIGCSELSILWSLLGDFNKTVWSDAGIPTWDTIQWSAEEIAKKVYDESL